MSGGTGRELTTAPAPVEIFEHLKDVGFSHDRIDFRTKARNLTGIDGRYVRYALFRH